MAGATFDLDRFVRAQEGVCEDVARELRGGRKRTHWMWFVFPQMRGLGQSSMAQHYGISSLEEARSFASHPVLGRRLVEWTRLVNGIEGRTAHDIFGSPDDVKFRSSMTLFATAAGDPAPFREALAKYWAGAPCARTMELLSLTPAP